MADSFLTQCRENYLFGITPANPVYKEQLGYKKVIAFAKQDFDQDKYEDFAGYFMEGQYLVPLWAAHMLIEYGTPNKEILIMAFDTIKEYSDNPLAPEVAEEEVRWMRDNADKYKEFI